MTEQNATLDISTFDGYATGALRTVSPITDQTRRTIQTNGRTLRGVLETLIHLGVDIDQMKKSIFYGKYADANEFYLRQTYDQHASLGEPIEKLTDAQVDLLHAIFGIVGEACEMVAVLLFPESHTDPYAKGGLVEEAGDTLWYLPLALRSVGATLAETAAANNRKLLDKEKGRYASGSFTQGEALNRNTDAEIEALKESPTKSLPGCCDEK